MNWRNITATEPKPDVYVWITDGRHLTRAKRVKVPKKGILWDYSSFMLWNASRWVPAEEFDREVFGGVHGL